MAGCPETPFGTVVVEDEQGQKIGSAWDKNFDGEPDIDPVTGEVDLLLPKAAYTVAQQVDGTAPALLKTVGGLFGVSFLTVLGLLWKNRRLAGFAVNVVESVQAVRHAAVEGGIKGALEAVDHALGSVQTPATRAKVTDLKKAAGLPSVTNPQGD